MRKIGIIDCNNFYVSCERVFNPESIGRPTVVLSNNDGCVIARSQESKDLGIKMGQPFFKSRDFMEEHRFCVYSSNYNLYGDMSDRVMSVIKQFAKEVEVYSIDESFVDFSDLPDEHFEKTLHFIRDEVKRKTGIPVSIGVGPNKTLAKMTSSMAKKSEGYNGVCSYWSLRNFRTMMYRTPVDDVWGIGRRWSKMLKRFGIETVGQFMNMSDGLVRKKMNISGLRTKHELLGEYCHVVQTRNRMKKNIASTRSFGSDVDDFNQISEAMYAYIKNGVRKLKQNKIDARHCVIFVSGNKHKGEGHYKSKHITFQESTQNIDEIWAQVHPYLRKIFSKKKSYKKCGIIFNELTPDDSKQLTLFTEPLQTVSPPVNKEKKWEMKQNFITQKYTTSWDDIPVVSL